MPICRECHTLIHAVGLYEALGRRRVPLWQLVETVVDLLLKFHGRELGEVPF